jgi:hypothetical protein
MQGGVALLADPCRGSIEAACSALAREGLRVHRRQFNSQRLPDSAVHLRHGFGHGAEPKGQLIWAELPAAGTIVRVPEYAPGMNSMHRSHSTLCLLDRCWVAGSG